MIKATTLRVWLGCSFMLLPMSGFSQAPVEDIDEPVAEQSLQTLPREAAEPVTGLQGSSTPVEIPEAVVEISAVNAINSNPGQAVLGNPVVETSPKTANAEIFYQLQTLQQEVQALRGIVEQQQFEINKLRKQRLDDYIDLDRRIGQLTQGSQKPVASTTSQPSSASKPVDATSTETTEPETTTGTSPTPSAVDEKASYDKAYAFLKQRQVAESMSAFEKHLQDYPEGDYAANALYWLGELHLLKGDISQAEKQFSDLLAKFPLHRKADDARFKLAKVYFQQGKIDSSRQLLEALVSENTDISRLAKSFLESNF